MPTNQSSPWGGAKLRACSTANRPTSTNSVRTHAKTGVATKVPFNQTSLELSRRNDPAKPLSSKVASSASPLRRTTASMVSVLENGNGNVTTHSQFTTVPDGSDNLPQQLHGINNPNQVLDGKQPQRHQCHFLIPQERV
ncbi:hypothetical protein OYC64_018700 [Pagothenia borchgrevinki]|uniref:Uncharacterized protein n=1 Tax=Pagothenia borchgrevinki TaxID=8213 RepID=A0ABD2GQ74_PAGBO